MILSICTQLLKKQIRSTADTCFRWLAPIGLSRIPMNHLAIAALGHLYIDNLQKFLQLIFSAIPKEEKKSVTLATARLHFILKLQSFLEIRKKKCICADILSSLGDSFSSQVENTMQTPLSSCCLTSSDSVMHWLS